ncbi:ATP-binding protein [Longimicrobium terrae]|uniref:histidine kinase n=1 Tax=Longimicrobium terrae TaxID=1639882 RepID=A0A841H127_9BACT|nr:ATP-binding protein [Longimicrobium terrae]MBB4637266.1 signal transduction histidine kinase [Longimicrobium terrae]MBB6071664.1 signal transduction histidine kinase [Longimicrobium terrae]NNC28425.1 PAS domain-containing protein [Longimicrobium terrae]
MSRLLIPRDDLDGEAAALIPGGGETGRIFRQTDWARTPLGPVSGWPQSLRTIASAVLGSAVPNIVLWGPDLVQIYNDGYVPFLGVKHPWGFGIPTRECWPEAWDFNEPIYHRVFAGETVSLVDQPYQLRRAGPDAPPDTVYITISYSPVRGEGGAVGGVFITLFDTTSQVTSRALQAERERLTRDLEIERERLAAVFQHAPSFLAVLRGPDHVFTLANGAYYQLVGHREIIGKPVIEALPEVAGQGFIELLNGVLWTGTPYLGRELPILLARTPGAQPEERYVDFTYLPLVEGEGERVGIIAHGFDVTGQVLARREVERLLAESEESRREMTRTNELLSGQQVELEVITEQLQENAAELEAQTEALADANLRLQASEGRLRGIFDQTPIPLAVMSGPDHVYTIVSPRYTAFGGGRPLLGIPFRQAFPETLEGGLGEILDRVYEAGEPFFASERPVFIDRDGDGVPEEYLFDVGYQPLRDTNGQVYALVSIANDVTHQVRARGELERARAEAEEANRAKSEFLANMSHELRTPLNAIGGYTELMELEIHGPVTTGQRDMLQRVQAAQRHLLTLINDILSYARLEAGRVEFDLEPLSARRVLGSLDALIAPQAASKQIAYQVLECDGELRFMGDEERVRQILVNLVSNAVKFTEAGGRVVLRCDADAEWGYLRVEDNGRGVPAEKLESIFDPFTQVDRRLDQPQGGVGLGLAISRDLALGMGGDLTAESTLGQGSTFTLRLPLVRGD